MAEFPWADASFLNLVQSIGVIGTVLIGIAALNRDARSREIENLLTLKQQHHELWAGASQRPELKRIFQKDVDVLAEQPTVQEEEFLNEAFVHFEAGWAVAKTHALITLRQLRDDIRSFLAYPLRRAVWEKTQAGRNPDFVRFVRRAIERRGQF